jgi:hypothetical protein
VPSAPWQATQFSWKALVVEDRGARPSLFSEQSNLSKRSFDAQEEAIYEHAAAA